MVGIRRTHAAGRRVVLTLLLVVVAAFILVAAAATPRLNRRFGGSAVHALTARTPAPLPVAETYDPAPVLERLTGFGSLMDSRLLAAQGEVLAVHEKAHRHWTISAFDARTGAVRWSYGRDNVAHIHAYSVGDGVVVADFHHTPSRLAWRLGRGATMVGLNPVSGEVLWQRSDVIFQERAGSYQPAEGSAVEAYTQRGRRVAIDMATGRRK